MSTASNLEEYLGSFVQSGFRIESLPEQALRGLPVYLARSYRLIGADLFGRRIVLANRCGEEAPTPTHALKDVRSLREHFRSDVALVVDEMPAWKRVRYIEHAIPFIVPGRHLYLPMLLMEMREFSRPAAQKKPTRLGWGAQALYLRHLLFRDVNGRALGELATILGYTPAVISSAKGELESLGLCKVASDGTSKTLVFPPTSANLWESSQSYLRSPIKRIHPVARIDVALPASGISALSRLSSLAEDSVPHAAIYTREYRTLLSKGTILFTEDPDEAVAMVQEWHYDPRRLTNTGTVDPLSLHLSLMDDPDERVQIALHEMLENFQW